MTRLAPLSNLRNNFIDSSFLTVITMGGMSFLSEYELVFSQFLTLFKQFLQVCFDFVLYFFIENFLLFW